MACYNCSNLCVCWRQRIWSTIIAPFQETYWLSNAAASIGSSWRGWALPAPILLLLELTQTSASHPPQAGRLQPDFLERTSAQCCNYTVYWMYTVVEHWIEESYTNKPLLGQGFAIARYSGWLQTPLKYFRFWILFPSISEFFAVKW